MEPRAWRAASLTGPFGPGRVHLSTRSLLNDPLRFAMSLSGITFAVILVLLLQAIMDGTVAKSTAYIDNAGADIYVARKGVSNMALAASTLPEETESLVAATPGVAAATGIVRFNVIASGERASKPAILIGYDPAAPLGGPWKLAKGRGVIEPGEAVLDEVLASSLSVRLGQTVEIGGQPLVAVGFSRGTAGIAGKLVFVHRDTARALINAPGIVSFILVRAGPGASAAALADAIDDSVPGIEAMTRAELSANDRDLLGDLFVQPINVMTIVGFLVGIAIVGLTMYTTTSERLRDFGVLKAIGASSGFLLRTVVSQALFLGVTGFALGLAGVLAIGPLVVMAVPDIGVAVEAAPALRAFGAMLGMSFAGAAVPVIRIMGVDPLIVFRR
jgi:putative ABC transport system permease protein